MQAVSSHADARSRTGRGVEQGTTPRTAAQGMSRGSSERPAGTGGGPRHSVAGGNTSDISQASVGFVLGPLLPACPSSQGILVAAGLSSNPWLQLQLQRVCACLPALGTSNSNSFPWGQPHAASRSRVTIAASRPIVIRATELRQSTPSRRYLFKPRK